MDRSFVIGHVSRLTLIGGLVLILASALVLVLRTPGLATASQPPPSRPLGPEVVRAPAPAFASELQARLPPTRYSATEPAPFPNCRYGVTAWMAQMQEFDIISGLNAGWYLDFGWHWASPGPAEAEYVQMIHLSQEREGSDVCGPDYGYAVSPTLTDGSLGTLVADNPGALWIVGNEPDRVGQDDVCPQQYAQAYHDVYSFIKARDPMAQVAVSGLVQVTPGRLQYLDIVWDTYLATYGAPMPVDVWTVHVYVLSETGEGDANIALGTDPSLAIPHSFDCADPNSFCHAEHDDIDLFIKQIMRMRRWMKRHGYQARPLLITEYGILKPYHYYGTCSAETCPPEGLPGCFCDENQETFHPRRVADFMEATFDYLMTASDPKLGYPEDGDRLVQQWLWYSLAVEPWWEPGNASNLVEPGNGYAFTVQGRRWQDYVRAISPLVNLLPRRVPTIVRCVPSGTGPVTVTLSAVVVNTGNTVPGGIVTVTFYSDEGLTMPVGSTTVTGVEGCAWREVVATTMWANLSVGEHPFWVKVDSPDDIAESDETDNVGVGLVRITPYCLFLPQVSRDG